MQYGNIEKWVAGLKLGIDSRTKSLNAAMAIPLGYPVFQLKGNEESGALLSNDKATVLYSADFVALNVITVDVLRANASGGMTTDQVSVEFDTDQATTLANLRAVVGGIDGITESGSAARTLILTSDTGEVITVTTVVTLGASQATATITAANSGNQVFVGISQHSHNEPAEYPSGKMVNVMIDGWMVIYCATACVSGEKVYYNSNGEFANAGTEAVGVTFDSNLSAAGLASVRINK